MAPKQFIRNTPHLPVNDLRQTLNFYRDKLGFSDEWIWGNKDGGIRRDGMRLLFAEDPEFTSEINSSRHCLPLMWFVSNIDEIYQEFQTREITIVSTLKSFDYGLREFAFIDINGYYIRVAEPQAQAQDQTAGP
jgi:catechol 2,3-dioxygenase-like lactoylglutathione lyase family enzyme